MSEKYGYSKSVQEKCKIISLMLRLWRKKGNSSVDSKIVGQQIKLKYTMKATNHDQSSFYQENVVKQVSLQMHMFAWFSCLQDHLKYISYCILLLKRNVERSIRHHQLTWVNIDTINVSHSMYVEENTILLRFAIKKSEEE